MMIQCFTFLYLIATLAAEFSIASSRAVNISNTWFLPQEGFPVFYRYFRDRITWFEADAVCQFHHANLVTVDSSKQYDTTRAYLKELDVVSNVWIGLKKKGPNDEFLWTDYRTLAHDGGYWQEQIPKSEAALCAAIDPAADFRWHSLNCGGPETASFICELPVPPWARKADGCMLTALPSLTVTYLPEQAAVELTSDCGLDGTRRIACKGQADRDEMMRQLSCDNGSDSSREEEKPVLASSTTLSALSSTGIGGTESHQPPTRHRRDADDVSSLVLGTLRSTSTLVEETITNSHGRTTSAYDDTSTVAITNTAVPTMTTFLITSNDVKFTTQEVTIPVSSSTNDLFLTKTNHDQKMSTTADPSTVSATKMVHTEHITVVPDDSITTSKELLQKIIMGKPPVEPNLTTEMKYKDKAVLQTTSSSMSSTTNSGFASPDALTKVKEIATAFGEEKIIRNNSEEIKTQEQFLKVETTSKSPSFKTANTEIKVNVNNSTNANFMTSNGDFTPKESMMVEKLGNDRDNEGNSRQFLPASLRGPPHDADNQTIETETISLTDWTQISDQQDNADDFQMLENEPEIPARPNRGRRLTRPQSHSFYPYFLNRVLG